MNFPDLQYKPTISVQPWECHIAQEELDRMRTLIQLSPPARRVYESSGIEKDLGVTAEWLEMAKKNWLDTYDWRKTEETINGFRNYKAHVPRPEKGRPIAIHFIGLFSKKQDAVPLIMMHGWPGSFLEFIPLLQHLSTKRTPEDLPVHLVVPSLVGFGFSDAPPPEEDFDVLDCATIMDALMRGLGFEEYLAQGGDIGHHNARLLGERFSACKGFHVNFFPTRPPPNFDMSTLDSIDQKHVQRMEEWDKYETSYLYSQALKPGTTGLALDSSPIAVLAWTGEKFHSWTHATSDIPLSFIIANASLYFLTQTSTSSLYHYRTAYGRRAHHDRQPGECKHKPVGYSQFAREVLASPIPWVAAKTDLVYSKRHDKGGHFAALEQPVLLWEDVSEFIKRAWKPRTERSSL